MTAKSKFKKREKGTCVRRNLLGNFTMKYCDKIEKLETILIKITIIGEECS